VPEREGASAGDAYEQFRGKCEDCFGLCCVAPRFPASTDFAFSKEAGEPCPNLATDFRCTIHSSLNARGFRGCVTYDCLGAGQKVSQLAFGGRSWRDAPETAEQMFETFRFVRHLQEMLIPLTVGATLKAAAPLRRRLDSLREEIDRLTRTDAAEILAADVAAYRRRVNGLLLLLAGNLARADVTRDISRRGVDLRGTDLSDAYLRRVDFTNASLHGAQLARADLRGANLTNADLTQADLTGADLTGADLTGADLTGADLTGADLTGADLTGADLTGADLTSRS
jgi:uncharacterized protein YjbI with pentapeptide repeats